MRLSRCDCSRGAPLGRTTVHGPVIGRGLCFRVRLDAGGYDAGGAYWGLGGPLYGLADDEGEKAFVRAGSREAAMAEFEKDFGPIRWARGHSSAAHSLSSLVPQKGKP